MMTFNTSRSVNIDLFWDVWNILEDRYVEEEKVSESERYMSN